MAKTPKRKGGEPQLVGRTSIELLNWLVENYPAILTHVEQNDGALTGYPFPNEAAKTLFISVAHDPQRGLEKVFSLKAQAEAKQLARKPKGMADDARRQFELLDRLGAAMPSRMPSPGPDMGNDPELWQPPQPSPRSIDS
jgi:hypothetical protein